MADRFPSIEDIDEGQTGTNNDNDGFGLIDDGGDGGDGGDDFLARERAALGDEFSTPRDNVPSVSVQDGADDDLMGGGGMNGTSDDVNEFQSSFPAIDTSNERMAPGGTITGTGSPFLPNQRPTSSGRATSPQPPSTSGYSYDLPAEEPEVIKTWRTERNAQIEKREEAAAARKAQTVKDAQTSIDEFYENYNNKRDKGVKQTQKDAEEFLNSREDTTAGGTSWERIAKLVDIRSSGGKGAAEAAGKERFRELLGSLAKDENAPGAKGY